MRTFVGILLENINKLERRMKKSVSLISLSILNVYFKCRFLELTMHIKHIKHIRML